LFRSATTATAYDWDSSLWTDSNVALDAGTGDEWDMTAPKKRSLFYQPHGNRVEFWLDSSGANKALKIAYTFHNYHADDDFNAVDTGVRLGTSNVVVASATGVEFSGGNMVDGDHAIQYKFLHDVKSGDIFYSNTIVLNCASNVLTVYVKWVSHSSSYQAYESVADTKVSGNKKIEFTWDSSANTWSVQTDALNIFNIAFDSDCVISGSGGTIRNLIDDVNIDGDTGDHRIWEVSVA
jgi:hypothetical protein